MSPMVRPTFSPLAAAGAVLAALLAACDASDGPAADPAPRTEAPTDAPAPAPELPDASDFAPPGAGRQALVGRSEPAPSPWAQPLGGPVSEELGAVTIAAPRFEFGRVFEGTQVAARFTVQCSSDVPISVVAVQTSCGCTHPVLWRLDAEGERIAYETGTPLARGERLAVEVQFDTRHRNGREEKPVYLYANVPGGRIDLELRGEVVPLLVVDPPELEFGEVLAGRTAAREFRVESADGAPVRVDVQSDALPVGLEFELVPEAPNADGASATWRGTARLGAAATPGVLRWPVRLLSDRTSEGTSGAVPLGGSVQVSVDLLAPIEISPPHLSLGVLQRGVMRAEHAMLRVHDTSIDPARLVATVEAEFSGAPVVDAVRARIVPGAAPGEFALELAVGELPAGRGRLGGRVHVATPDGTARGVLGFTGVLTSP